MKIPVLNLHRADVQTTTKRTLVLSGRIRLDTPHPTLNDAHGVRRAGIPVVMARMVQKLWDCGLHDVGNAEYCVHRRGHRATVDLSIGALLEVGIKARNK